MSRARGYLLGSGCSQVHRDICISVQRTSVHPALGEEFMCGEHPETPLRCPRFATGQLPSLAHAMTRKGQAQWSPTLTAGAPDTCGPASMHMSWIAVSSQVPVTHRVPHSAHLLQKLHDLRHRRCRLRHELSPADDVTAKPCEAHVRAAFALPLEAV